MTLYKTIQDLDLKDRYVLLRADLNVPRQNGKVTDTTRIDRLKPTIDYLVKNGAKTLVLSHFGRPDGEQNPQMSLAFLTGVLESRWNAPVSFAQNCIGDKAHNARLQMKSGDVVLLENVRFHKGEKNNDPEFCKALAELGDVFVHDAFSAAHRAHASTCGIAEYLPTVAGLLMSAELKALENALGTPEHPVMAIVGGSKISTKLDVLNNLIEKVDYLVLGGGMANTFLHAQGTETGASLCEKDMAEQARTIMKNAKNNNCQIILPIDVVTVQTLKTNAEHHTHTINAIPTDHMAVDLGPESTINVITIMEHCKTVVWNGPMGVFEITPFDTGTNTLARAVADQTLSGRLKSIAGGGDTVAALENADVTEAFSYISTAGGAFLEWLEGKDLPGVQALYNQK